MVHYFFNKFNYLIAGIILFVISLLFYLFQTRHLLFCCDAVSYLDMIAPLYQKSGVFANHEFANLRTYFYPWLLSLLLSFSKITSLSSHLLVWVFQSLAYFGAVAYLTQMIARTHKTLAVISLFLLCLNVYFIPYLSITLTDGFCTALVIFWVALIIHAYQKLYYQKNLSQVYVFMVAALVTSSIALVVRPAGIWLSFATAVILIYYLFEIIKNRISWSVKSFLILLLLGVIAGIAYLLPLLPQIYINLLYFGKLSAFPAVDLGQGQIRVGIQYLKYGTNISSQMQQMFYPNPLYVATLEAPTFRWYFAHPAAAFATIMLKFVGAFDFDYITPYVNNLKPWYRWLSGFFSLSIMYFGLWGVISYAFGKMKNALFFGPRFFPVICLLSWASVVLLSVYELRFGLPILTLFVIFTAERALYLQKMNRALLYRSLTIYLCIMAVLLLLAGYVAKQNVLLQ